MEGRKEDQKAEYPQVYMKKTKEIGVCMEERGSTGKPGRKAQKKVEAER